MKQVPWHVFLAAIGAVLLMAVVGILAGTGSLGPEVKLVFADTVKRIHDYYLVNEKVIDGIAKIGGLLVTVIGGLATIVTGYVYADRNLPYRLQAYLEKSNQQVVAGRRDILRVWEESRTSIRSRSSFLRTSEDFASLARKTSSQFEPLKLERNINAERAALIDKKIADAHLIAGLKLVKDADAALKSNSSRENLANVNQLRGRAIEEFKSALGRDSTIYEAAKFASLQYVKLSELDDGFEYAKVWHEIASGLPIEKALAGLHMAEIGVLRSNDPSLPQGTRRELLDSSQRQLETMGTAIQSDEGFNGRQEKPAVLGQVFELAGDVRRLKENIPTANQRYQSAAYFYAQAQLPDAVGRVEKKRNEMLANQN